MIGPKKSPNKRSLLKTFRISRMMAAPQGGIRNNYRVKHSRRPSGSGPNKWRTSRNINNTHTPLGSSDSWQPLGGQGGRKTRPGRGGKVGQRPSWVMGLVMCKLFRTIQDNLQHGAQRLGWDVSVNNRLVGKQSRQIYKLTFVWPAPVPVTKNKRWSKWKLNVDKTANIWRPLFASDTS